MSFTIHPTLLADSHEVDELPFCSLRLMDDSRWPWMILVPHIAGAREIIDLDASDQQALLAEIVRVGRALETTVQPDKLNVASLGNVVSQLHVHVIARFTNDAAWPRPVWGIGERVPYAEARRNEFIREFRNALNGQAG